MSSRVWQREGTPPLQSVRAINEKIQWVNVQFHLNAGTNLNDKTKGQEVCKLHARV